MANTTESFEINATLSNKSSIEESEPNILTYYHEMTIVVYPIIVAVGLVGNFLSFLVFSHKQMRSIPTSICYSVVSFTDSGVLLTATLTYWIRDYFNFNFWTISRFTCSLVMYLLFWTSCSSIWILCLSTIQRFQIVIFPLSAKTSITVRRTRISLFVTLVVLLSIYIPSATEAIIYETPGLLKRCRIDWNPKFWAIFSILDFMCRLLLPLCLQIILNSVIVIFLQRASTKRKRMVITQARSDKESNKMLKMVLTVNFYYIVTYSPLCFFVVFSQLNKKSDFLRSIYYIFGLEICFLMAYFNHVGNFFIYLSSGKKFRDVFKSMFCTCGKNGNDANSSIVATNINRSRSGTTHIAS